MNKTQRVPQEKSEQLLSLSADNMKRDVERLVRTMTEEAVLYTDVNSNNALHVACQNHAIETACFFAQIGPSTLLDQKNADGLIPIFCASYRIQQGIFELDTTQNLKVSLQKELATILNVLINQPLQQPKPSPSFFSKWLKNTIEMNTRYQKLHMAVREFWIKDQYQGILDTVYDSISSLTPSDLTETSPFHPLMVEISQHPVLQRALGLRSIDSVSTSQAEIVQIAFVKRFGERYASPEAIVSSAEKSLDPTQNDL